MILDLTRTVDPASDIGDALGVAANAAALGAFDGGTAIDDQVEERTDALGVGGSGNEAERGSRDQDELLEHIRFPLTEWICSTFQIP
jgi:hypothetical protein